MRLLRKEIIISTLIGSLVLVVTGCSNSQGNISTTEVQQEVITETLVETESKTTEAENEDTTEVATEAETMSKDIFQDSGIRAFELSSEDLHDGVWDTIITDTENGSNVSPQLTWEAVPDAECYVIYMVDTTAGDWIHWKSNNVTETTLPQGWAPEDEYVGPYPPGGTHDYEIYVIALKQPVERAKGAFNGSNLKFKENVMSLDEVEEGASGNIIAYGHITGTYTYGD